MPEDLYTECSQICVGLMPAGLQAGAQLQFVAHLAIENGNPTYANLTRDFERFGLALNLHLSNPQQLTDLGQLNQWRNKAAHQGTKPLGGGVPTVLTLPVVQGWKTSPDDSA